jgi:hypothetical protein
VGREDVLDAQDACPVNVKTQLSFLWQPARGNSTDHVAPGPDWVLGMDKVLAVHLAAQRLPVDVYCVCALVKASQL